MSYNKKFIKDVSSLAAMSNAGVSLLAGLGCISDGQDHWSKIQTAIKNGSTFSEAIRQTKIPDVTDYELESFALLVHAGELGGVIEVILSRFVKSELDGGLNDEANFVRYFGLLLSCGVPILTAIKNIPTQNANLVTLKEELHKVVKNGDSVTEAFKASKAYPEYAVAIINAGELTGALPEALVSLADTIENLNKI